MPVKLLNEITERVLPKAIPKDEHVIKRMKGNKHRDTSPELILRKLLREKKLTGYRLHYTSIIGKPDIVYIKRKIAVFLHGCFWHLCPNCNLKIPTHNHEFWKAKLLKNKQRDDLVFETLSNMGWKVITIWECELKNKPDEQIAKVEKLF